VPEYKLKERLYSDPNCSVIAITNTLDYFDIENMAASVPSEAYSQLPNTFIAQVSKNGNSYIVLATKQDTDSVKISVSEKNIFTVSVNEFLADWTGTIVAIDPNREGKTFDMTKMLKSVLPYAASVIMAAYLYLTTYSLLTVLYFVLSASGLVVGYFITREKFGFDNALSKLCTITKSTDCNTVFNSKEAKLFNIFDLSDLTIIYFLFVTSVSVLDNYSPLLFFVSCATLPVIIYSVYYQLFKIKKICPLCIVTSTVLALQFVVMLLMYNEVIFNYADLLLYASLFGIAAMFWVYAKPMVTKVAEHRTLILDNLKFRRNHNLFIPYYNTLNRLNMEADNVPVISVGSSNPLVTITAVTNPLCKMCTEAHKTYLQLLQNYNDTIRINFLFLVPNKNRNDIRTQISERLIQLYTEENTDSFMEAFNNWYESLNAAEWLNRYGHCTNNRYNNEITKQVMWCLKNDIEATPAIVINGKLFPDTYTPTDIENFIEHIIEFECVTV
jgi:uncharacterized membrane protein